MEEIKYFDYLCSWIADGHVSVTRRNRASFQLLFARYILIARIMKEIKLTQGKVALVDDEDYEMLNQWKWYADFYSNNFYAVRSCGYRGRRKIRMHRIIMNTPSGLDVDHADHNTLNNQKYNLRNCTRSQNQMNKRARGKSDFLGVCITGGGRIKSTIVVDGTTIYLGYFKTEEEAALAYDRAAKKYHKEFANLNFK